MRQSSLNVYLAWAGQSSSARGSLLVWRERQEAKPRSAYTPPPILTFPFTPVTPHPSAVLNSVVFVEIAAVIVCFLLSFAVHTFASIALLPILGRNRRLTFAESEYDPEAERTWT
ncbi:MAG: hypothetical protein FE78DRAFT_493502 [Acidomyces sp. 'richmondensis']|nr:MAG: hypothetical protein FE78DRAFT_493502 [Acidomyces sp. 'richmondensis']